jgi:xanthine dehydrogenase accessory factor
MKDICDILREVRRRRREEFALATLVRVEGSSYRRPGARMLICADGKTVGSLSGGCLEEEVALQARDVLRTGVPALMSFDTRRRFGCAGKIDIFIERISNSFFVDVAKHVDARRRCIAVTVFEGNQSELGSSVVRTEAAIPVQGEVAAIDPIAISREVDRSGDWGQSPLPSRSPIGNNNTFIQEIHPPIQLLICGDAPDNKPLRLLAELLGWVPVEIVDLSVLSIAPDEWTAALVKSHNYGRDFAALQQLLPMNLRYVGLMGPRRRRDQLLNALLDVGVAINAGFFAPAGLDLKAETPEEIALAIVSEIQRVFAGGTGESLRERKFPIHDSQQRGEQSGRARV